MSGMAYGVMNDPSQFFPSQVLNMAKSAANNPQFANSVPSSVDPSKIAGMVPGLDPSKIAGMVPGLNPSQFSNGIPQNFDPLAIAGAVRDKMGEGATPCNTPIETVKDTVAIPEDLKQQKSNEIANILIEKVQKDLIENTTSSPLVTAVASLLKNDGGLIDGIVNKTLEKIEEDKKEKAKIAANAAAAAPMLGGKSAKKQTRRRKRNKRKKHTKRRM